MKKHGPAVLVDNQTAREIISMKLHHFSILSIIIAAVCMPASGCKGNRATDPCFIVITSPTGNDTYCTENYSIDLSGFCMNAAPLSHISWAADTGAAGRIQAASEWEIGSVPLEPGDTAITVQAASASGTILQDTLTVTCNPYVSFAGAPAADPETFFTNEQTPVTFTAALNDPDALSGAVVEVVRADTAETGMDTVATLYDDGDAGSCDGTAGDGTYCGTALFIESDETQIPLRVKVTTDVQGGTQTAYSSIFSIRAVSPFTDDELDRALSFPAKVLQEYEGYCSQHEETEARQKTVAWLLAQNDVADAGAPEQGSGIWYELSSGFVQGLLLNRRGGDTNMRSFQSALSPLSSPAPASADSTDEDTADPRIGNNRALVIAPFHSYFGQYSMAHRLDDIFDKAPCPGMKVTTITDSSADIAAFKTMGSYGAVCIDSHGGLANGTEFIMTGEVATKNNIRSYAADIKLPGCKKRLIGQYDNNTLYYALTPAFIRHYCKGMPDSIVHSGCCFSLYTGEVANAFLASGARVYSGYTGEVDSEFTKDIAESYWGELTGQLNAQQAYSSTISTVGLCDPYGSSSPRACFLWGGDGNRMIPPDGPCTETGFTRITFSGPIGDGECFSSDVIVFDPVDEQYRIRERHATCSAQGTISAGGMSYSYTCSGSLDETYEDGEEPYKFFIDEDGTGGGFEPNPAAKDYYWVTCTSSFGETDTSDECWYASWPLTNLREDEISETGISGTRTAVGESGMHTATLEFQYAFPELQ